MMMPGAGSGDREGDRWELEGNGEGWKMCAADVDPRWERRREERGERGEGREE
jgi:hypothetical protein